MTVDYAVDKNKCTDWKNFGNVRGWKNELRGDSVPLGYIWFWIGTPDAICIFKAIGAINEVNGHFV